jgi:hypothetical protein
MNSSGHSFQQSHSTFAAFYACQTINTRAINFSQFIHSAVNTSPYHLVKYIRQSVKNTIQLNHVSRFLKFQHHERLGNLFFQLTNRKQRHESIESFALNMHYKSYLIHCSLLQYCSLSPCQNCANVSIFAALNVASLFTAADF